MKLTCYGHATFAIEVKGIKLLFDPFFSGNPAAKNIDADRITADYIFVTHGHGDHMADLAVIAKRTGAVCVCAPEIVGWLGQQGVEKTHPLNHGGSFSFEGGKAKSVNAVHSSSFTDRSYAGNPMGFVFTTPEGNFYVAGDTALTMDMQLIPRWARLDFAIMPIGGNYTMDPTDAILAADFVQCDKIVGVHYNTWPIIRIDVEKAKAEFSAAGKELLLPAVGETIEL